MPQPLRRKRAPIDWSVYAVANHPVLNSGVGASITAFSSLEAALGAYLVLIRWKHPDDLVEQWQRERTTRGKRRLVEAEAGNIPNAGFIKETTRILDSYTALAKRRAKLAHGFFGVITDRENQFAWRPGEAAAQKAAMGLTATLGEDLPDPKTWVYTPQDFEDLTTECGSLFGHIQTMFNLVPMVYALDKRLPDDGGHVAGNR